MPTILPVSPARYNHNNLYGVPGFSVFGRVNEGVARLRRHDQRIA